MEQPPPRYEGYPPYNPPFNPSYPGAEPLHPGYSRGYYGGRTLVNYFCPLGPNSTNITCPHCQNKVQTKIEKDHSLIAYFSSLMLCFLGCFCGCCLIPFFVDDCKVTEHTCPQCTRVLGRYSKFY